MISTPNLEQAKKQILSKLKENKKPIIVRAQNPEFNRKIIEYGKFHILLFPESRPKKDRIKYLDTGINHISAKIMSKNKIEIGFNLNQIRLWEKDQKAKELARLKSLVKTAGKAKTKIKLLNIKNKKNAFCLLTSLGASTQQSKESTQQQLF